MYTKATLEFMAGGGASFVLWGYVSTDAKADIDTAGYFNGAAGQLRVGDWIMINAGDGSGIFIVNANDGSTVDVSDATAVGGADTD